MTCQQARIELKAYLDGELPFLTRWQVKRHLGRCTACREELASLKRIGQMIKTLKVEDLGWLAEGSEKPSPSLREQILDRFRTERSQIMNTPPKTVDRPAQRRYLQVWQYVGSAAVVILLFGIFYPVFNQKREKANAPESFMPYAMKGKMMGGMPGEMQGMGSAGMPGMMGKGPGMMAGGGADMPGTTRSAESDEGKPESAASAPSAFSGRKIIRTADISLEVPKFQEAYDRVAAIAGRHRGFVADSQSQIDQENYKYGSMTLKVPGDSFEKAVKDICTLEKAVQGIMVLSKQMQGQDVTDDYVDTQARIRNLKHSEERLLEIMKRIKELDEVLRMEQELARVRGEIEQMTAHAVNLERQSALATITVTIQEKRQVPLPKRSSWDMFNTTKDAVNSLLTSLSRILTLIIWAVVYSPFWAPLAFLGIYAYRKRRAQQAEEAQGNPPSEGPATLTESANTL